MANYENLSSSIPNSTEMTESLLNDWNTVVEVLKNNYIVETKKITGVIAEKYRYDMEGLFLYLRIPRDYIYIHIRVNGYESSREYSGDIQDIKIIDPARLQVYHSLFTKK